MPSENAVEEVPDSENGRLEPEHEEQEPDFAGHSLDLVGTREAARHVAKQLGIAGPQLVDRLAMACAEVDHREGVGVVV
jgi:hypothetical protein